VTTSGGEHAERFTHLRPLLFTIVYEILGSATESDDVLQDSYLRWAEVDLATVRDQSAFLVRIATRQALDRLRVLGRRKESYVGTWLPEPLLTASDVAEDFELADSVSMAMLLVLETLTPTERAVFVLREVFGFEHGEIAAAVDKSPAAVRQIAHRAREHVQARRPESTTSRAEHAEVTRRFATAAATGDLEALLGLLAPDVVLVTDGGGVKKAALRPIVGVEKVLRFLSAVRPAELSAEAVVVNGELCLVVYIADELDGIFATRVVGGVVTELYGVRNPEKLSRLAEPVPLSR